MWVVVYLSAVLLVVATQWVYRWRNPKCKGLLPPGSMGFPIIGESIQYFSSHPLEGIHPFINKRTLRYGSLFRTSLVGQKVVFSTDPEVNHFIFQQEGKLFQLWYTESALKLTGKQGLTVHHGAFHRYLKNLILTLVSPENLKASLLSEMDHLTRKHLHSWTALPKFDVKEATETMIFKLVAKKVFSYGEKRAMELRHCYRAFIDGFISFPLNIPGTAHHASMRGRKNAIKLIKGTVKERRGMKEKHGDEDFLDYLLKEVDDESTFLTEQIAVDLMFVLLFATYETTSAAITLALNFLNQHPQALRQLQDEQQKIVASRENKDSPITWKEYKSMNFMHMVINETVRLGNIAPLILRKVMADVRLKGYTIPAGWTVAVCPSSVHLSADKYEDPLAFNPSRWNGQELHSASKKFMAFGGGQRLCAGADFAKMGMAILLHYLVTNYRWKVVEEGKIVRTPALLFLNGFQIQLTSLTD
ncbi:cytochrome P450 87A3-like [Ipomoea triloba]|uniref:cytochrome P450 87A3-like n=1 Tax=Ipomoea triloba TaxID=35885 RepID=UPI00125D0B66|nr:cytochrome P450 87A3-like [Ipomoea triloba]